MFLQYYGLQEQPFGTTPDPRFYYMSPSHREAFASLVYGIETGRGFVALIARPGMGKTTVLFQLMERLRNSARTAFLFQNHGNSREFFSNLIADLGIEPAGQDLSTLQRQLNEVLIRESQQGKHFVVVIDEAQTLGDPVLETVRMLSNFETPHAKLLQIVLAGQPQLADKLAAAELSQLRQRVSIVSHLNPFNSQETAQYIEHRLKTAGCKSKGLFTQEALTIIAEQSEGIPRNINNLCFHALSLGYAKNQKKIDRLTMVEVLNDLDLEPLGTHPPEYHERLQERFDLDSVTLGTRAGERNRNRAAHGDYSLPFMSRRAASRVRGRSQPDVTHWLLWTVALLTLILLGEAFLDSLPAKSQQQVISKGVSEVIHEAKRVAASHDLFNPTPVLTPQPSQEPRQVAETERSKVNSDGNNPPVSPNNSASQSQSTVSLKAAPEQSNLVALDVETTSPSTANSAGVVTANLTPAIPPKRDSALTSNSTSEKDFGPSTDAGRLVVESNVSGGKITINGQSEPGWVTPHIFALPPGNYQVSVSKGGYTTWSRDVQVKERHKKWVLASLGLPRGVIVIQTDPPGMQVFIDGKAYGPSEVEASLDIGPHTYKVAPPPGEQPFVGAFNLKAGDILTRKVRWLPGTGSLHIRKDADRSESENRPTPRIGRGAS